MTELPKFAYDWLLTAKEKGLPLLKAINENHTESYTFDDWITSDDEHLRNFVDAWCGDDVKILEDTYRMYYLDNNNTKHYMKGDLNSTTNKLLSAHVTKSEWESILPKGVNSGFLQYEKVGD